MLTQTLKTAAREALSNRDVGPALDALEENVRQVRRALVQGRQAAEDMAAGAALLVRQHPLAAITSAMCAGLAAGALAGFVIGRNGRARA